MNKEESHEICKSNNAEKTNSAAVIEAKSLDAVFRRKLQAFVALVTLVFFLAWAEVHCLN